jgi:hypothetical protein
MIYTFLNKNTNEIEEYTMRLAEYDDFKENNPQLRTLLHRRSCLA